MKIHTKNRHQLLPAFSRPRIRFSAQTRTHLRMICFVGHIKNHFAQEFEFSSTHIWADTHTHTHPISKISAVAFWSMRFICQYKRWKGTTTRSKINNNKLKTIKEKRDECQWKIAKRHTVRERERERGEAMQRKIVRRTLYTNYANSSVKKMKYFTLFLDCCTKRRSCYEWANKRLCKKKKSVGNSFKAVK